MNTYMNYNAGNNLLLLSFIVLVSEPQHLLIYTARNITDLLQAVDFTELAQAVNMK